MKKLCITLGYLLACISLSNAQAIQTNETFAERDSSKTWNIHGENTFLINQSSFSNWAAGGINSFAGNLMLNYDFNYLKGKWSWDNKVIAAYGKTFMRDTDWRKNDDRLILNSLLGYQAADKWLYTFYANFNSQFTDGFNYASENNDRIAASFAPAFLTFGPGMAFKESDNFRVNISPAAAKMVFVGIDELKELYAVDLDKSVRTEFGASLDAYYKLDVMRNISLENILKLYSNYLEDPQNVDVDYTANLFMKVNEYISVNAGVQLLYDDNINVPKSNGTTDSPGLQVRQVFGAGFTYKF